ncbi:MAG: hypothetical protein HKP14_05810 [Bacteroidia bacterium]|nr:hypothetical protein [Bacteroidia bacterium]
MSLAFSVLKRSFIILLILCTQQFASAQTYRSTIWSGNIYLGASNMMGDLGGSNFIGSRGLFDYDFRSNRLAGGVGLNLHTDGSFSFGLNFLATRLYGDDAFSTQDFQVERNLCVRTTLIEFDFLIDYRPFSRSAGFNRFYIYSGVGGMYFNPQAELNDDWYNLREIGTEGQYVNGDNPYKDLEVVIPYGLGYKFRLAKSTSLILDLGFRKTFTDYLDDVSTVYVDPTLLNAAQPDLGTIPSQLADRSENGMASGSVRGNPDKDDSYHVLTLKFEYIFGGKSGDGCYYNRNPPKTRSTRINQRKMFTR